MSQHFQDAIIMDDHSTMINYEIPKSSINRLSDAFRLLEENKLTLGLIDYSLSQSTLEQVFLKQIRGSGNDEEKHVDATNTRQPKFSDYVWGYAFLLLAVLIPGLHHFALGNTYRGFKYFFTLNEVMVGWFLDFFDMPLLVQRSVEEYGHIGEVCFCARLCSCCSRGCGFCCSGCTHFWRFLCCCCCICCRPKKIDKTQLSEPMIEGVKVDEEIVDIV